MYIFLKLYNVEQFKILSFIQNIIIAPHFEQFKIVYPGLLILR